MIKETKEEKKHSIMNMLLLVIILALIVYIYLLIKPNKERIVTAYEYGINVIMSNLKIEKGNEEASISDDNTNCMSVAVDDEYIIEEKYNFKEVTNNKYYYNQLNDNAKLIYESIENNLNNMTSGIYQINLPNEVANVLKYPDGENMLHKNFQSAWDALSLDRMDIFFIDISKITLNIKKTTYGSSVSYSLTISPQNERGYLEDGLANEESVNNMLIKINNSKNNIINNVNGDTYNTILKVHDWIIENLEYSFETQNRNVYNLYGALVENSAVCEGYAEAFKYILDELEIPCILVSGTAINSNGETENHAWNYVQLHEKWYAIDTTWDDPIVEGFGYITNSIKHKYFLQGSKTMDRNHTIRNRITEKGQEFKYPVLSKEEYKK